MAQNLTEKDFATLSWHDNIVYGLRFDVGGAQFHFDPVLTDEQRLPTADRA